MIKTLLKQNEISLVQFASDLSVSRPTLDIYIKNYDNNKTINNPLFQKIFDFLFEDISVSKDEFLNKYEYVKNLYGKKNTSISSIHSNSISREETIDDEYQNQCDKIIELLIKSKENSHFTMDKLRSIENLLLEETPDYEVVWQEKRNAIVKRNNIEIFYLCIIMEKDEPDAFKAEKVFFLNSKKYCILMENTSKDYLISITQNLQKVMKR